MLASLLACNNHHKLGNFASLHPFIQLRHDFLDVGFDLVVGGYCKLIRLAICLEWIR